MSKIFLPGPENIDRDIYSFDDNEPVIVKELENLKDSFDKILYKEKLPEVEIFTIDDFLSKYLYDPNIPKDLDDGVRVKKLGDGYKLITSIASPSEVIQRGSQIEKNAIFKTTSIYRPEEVIHMFPRELATYYLSLNYDRIRLALTTEIDFDKDGNVLDFKIYKSRVKNICMFNYELFTDNLIYKNSEFFDEVQIMNELRVVLNNKRKKEGSIGNFDDSNRQIGYHKSQKTHIASSFIEEAMIITNVEVAKFLVEFNINGFFRNHMPEYIGKEFEGNQMLRAYYSTMAEGHYALGFQYYMHFTSPIRRIVDYISHIVINNFLSVEKSEVSAKNAFDLVDYIGKRQNFILGLEDDKFDKSDKIDSLEINNYEEEKIKNMSLEELNNNLQLIFGINIILNNRYYKNILERIKIHKQYNGDLLSIMILSGNHKLQKLALELLESKSYNMFLKKFIDNNLRKKYFIKIDKVAIQKNKNNLSILVPYNKSTKYSFYKIGSQRNILLYENDKYTNKIGAVFGLINFIINSDMNYLK